MGGPDDVVLTLVEPRRSVVLERRPKFTWTGMSEASRYVLTVYDADEKIIWTTTTTGTSANYPGDQPPLAPGEYKWEVVAQVGDKVTGDPALYDATAFTLVSEEIATRINADLASAQAGDEGATALLYVSALIEHRRFPQAAAELKRSLEAAPQDAALWEMLMETCWQMKLWRTREYAKQLSEDPNASAETVRRLEPRR
jgi:hypothetical protein